MHVGKYGVQAVNMHAWIGPSVNCSSVSALQICIHFPATLQWLSKFTAAGRAFLAHVHLKNEGLICHQVSQDVFKCGPEVVVWVPAVVYKEVNWMTQLHACTSICAATLYRHTNTRPWWHRFPLGTLEGEAGSSLYQSLQQPAQQDGIYITIIIIV